MATAAASRRIGVATSTFEREETTIAEYEITASNALLSNLLSSGKEGPGELVESVLNQVLEYQTEEQLGAGRYERSEGRTGYRNGDRTRRLYSRVGSLVPRVPQFRDGAFSTEIFQRYQRSERLWSWR